MTDGESLDQFIERAATDPDALRAGFEAELLEEHGQEWVDENQQYFDAWWEQAYRQIIGQTDLNAILEEE